MGVINLLAGFHRVSSSKSVVSLTRHGFQESQRVRGDDELTLAVVQLVEPFITEFVRPIVNA